MLVPNQQKIELGNIDFGKPYDFDYILTNNSSNVVRINKIIVGCTSCTKASTKEYLIKPGKTTVINTTYTPGKTGPSTKHIQIIYDTTQNLRLEFTANVK